jgi:hypothetical protein
MNAAAILISLPVRVAQETLYDRLIVGRRGRS